MYRTASPINAVKQEEFPVPRPKQHHYVTRAYLAGFLSPGATQLVCYGRKGIPFKRSPDELGKRRNFYALRNKDGSWDDSLEELIERTVESPGLPVIKKLTSGKTRLSWEERRWLSLFIAFQETRTPAARERSRLMSKMFNERVLHDVRAADPNQISIGLVGKSGKSSEVSLDEMIASHEVLCDDHEKEIHKMQAGAAFKLHQMYQQMKWTVYYAIGNARFLTTDSPVIRVFHGAKLGGTGLNRSDLEVRFPLSANTFLTITHDIPRAAALMRAKENKRSRVLDRLPEVSVRYSSDADVLTFNKGHVRHAQRWVFASSEMDWIEKILAEPSACSEVIDMSNRNLLHFRSNVNYDPRMDC